YSMTRRALYSFVVAAVFLLVGCGKQAGGPPNPANPPGVHYANADQKDAKVQLALFAETNCLTCQHELPQLQQQLQSVLGPKRTQVYAAVYLIMGDNGEEITQPRADQFGKDYGLSDFAMVADDFGLNYYQKYFQGSGVPTAVILNADGSVIKSYPAGQVDVNDMVARVQNL